MDTVAAFSLVLILIGFALLLILIALAFGAVASGKHARGEDGEIVRAARLVAGAMVGAFGIGFGLAILNLIARSMAN